MPELFNDRVNSLLYEAESRLASVPKLQPKREISKPSTTIEPNAQVGNRRNAGILTIRDPSRKDSQVQDNAGPGWFGLPKTDPNDKELKRDLQLLQMRGTALDPHRHYKKESLKPRMPRYAHVGRIVEGPTEFYSARLSRKERKRNLMEELLATETVSGKFKSKYRDIQTRKSSGKKAFYRNFLSKRRQRN